MFSCLRDRKDIKEPWDPKYVYGVCVGVIMFVSVLFLAWRKLTAGSCGVLKVLCILCMCFFGVFLRLCFYYFFGVCLPRCECNACLCLFAFTPVCLCVPKQVRKLVMHACHPLHASVCTTELHMTSIWEQRDSDLITNSLLLIKTCRLHPPPSPFLSSLLSLFSTLSCFLVLSSPSHPHPTPPLPLPPLPPPLNSRVAPICGFSAACCQKGPHFKFCRKLEAPLFSPFSVCFFVSLFFALCCTSLV